MNIPIELFIIASSVIGCAIGFFGSSLMAARKIQRTEADTWQAANRYYSRRYKDRETAI
jgi:hypothetical protein